MRDVVPAVEGTLDGDGATLADVGAEGVRSGGSDTLLKVAVEVRGVAGVDVVAGAGDGAALLAALAACPRRCSSAVMLFSCLPESRGVESCWEGAVLSSSFS